MQSESANINIKILDQKDWYILEHVAAEVFDFPVRSNLVKDFLSDPRHHIVVALDRGEVIGFASGVCYIHPDKDAELFINEVGVAPSYQRQGIGKRLLKALLEKGRELGCQEAWVGTESDNKAAWALYASVGARQDPTPFVLYSFSLG